MNVAGARALVCGGASGLGAATARRLRAGGAHVVIADIDAERGEALARELEARFAGCDVTDAAQVESAVEVAGPDLRIAVTWRGSAGPRRPPARVGRTASSRSGA
jgi:NAD(P)-dependent dehydrogenase (short-subunit alcohol dehydrogenase family)